MKVIGLIILLLANGEMKTYERTFPTMEECLQVSRTVATDMYAQGTPALVGCTYQRQPEERDI